MRRGTTPTHRFATNVSLVDAEEIYVTYKQGSIILTKTKDDCVVTPDALMLKLTQEDTLMFKTEGCKLKIQIRAKFLDGTAIASNVIEASVERILKNGVI